MALTDFPPAPYTPAALPLTLSLPLEEGRWIVPNTLRKELLSFVMASDELIASMSKVQLSSAEQAIVDFYIKEIPAKAAKGTA
jgi:hypothetical protein